MDSTLNDKLIAGLDEELSSLRRELGVNPSDPPASIKRFRARPATIHRLANWRHLAFVGSLLAASMGVALVVVALRSYGDDGPLGPRTSDTGRAERRRADCRRPVFRLGAAAPTDDARSSCLKASGRTAQREARQLVRDNENVASQLKASQEEMARNNSIIDQIKATQIQMARESQTLTERLNASEERLPASSPTLQSQKRCLKSQR